MLRAKSFLSCLIVAVGSSVFFVPADVVGQQDYYPSFNFKPMWEIYGINPYFPKSCPCPVPRCQSGCYVGPSVTVVGDNLMYPTPELEIETFPPTAAVTPAPLNDASAPNGSEVRSEEAAKPDPILNGPETMPNEQRSLSDLPVDSSAEGKSPIADEEELDRLRKALEGRLEALARQNDSLSKNLETWRKKAQTSEERARAAERRANTTDAKTRRQLKTAEEKMAAAQKEVAQLQQELAKANARMAKLKQAPDASSLEATEKAKAALAAEKKAIQEQLKAEKAALMAEKQALLGNKDANESGKQKLDADKKAEPNKSNPAKKKPSEPATDAKSQIKRLEANRDRQIKQNTKRISKRFQERIDDLDKSDKKYEEMRKQLEDEMKKQIETMTQKIMDRVQKRIDDLRGDLNNKSLF